MRVLLLLLISLSLFANTLELYSSQKQTTKGYAKVIHDPNADYTHQDIFKENYTAFTTETKSSYKDNVVWTRTEIANKTDKALPLIFRNLRAGINEIDVFIYKDGALVASHLLGSYRDIKKRELAATKSIFYYALEPKEQITLIIKHKSMGTLDLVWELLDPREYSYLNSLELIFWGLFGGIVIALIIYNASIFLSLRDITFIYYILHATSVLLFNYSLNGVFFLLDVGLSLELLYISTWHLPIMMLIFLLLFSIHFFKLKENSKILYRLSRYTTISLIISFLFSFLLYFESSLAEYSPILALQSFGTILFVFFIGVWGVYKKLSGALFFLLGEGVYLLSLLYVLTIISGDSSQTLVGILLMPTAITIEVIMLSMALSFKIKAIYKEAEKNRLLLHQQNEFTKLGKLVGSISHQWRQPINLISSEIMYLLLLEKKGQKDVITEEFLKNAPKLQNTINHMSQTLSLFTNFYKPHKSDESFSLRETLSSLGVLSHHELILNKISFTIECDETLQIKTDRASLLNIMMIFLENSIYELGLSSVEQKEIKIIVSKKEQELEILFLDNAQNSIIEGNKIFESGSTKDKNSSGLGLKIAKELAQTKLGASLHAHREGIWSLFSLKLPLR